MSPLLQGLTSVALAGILAPLLKRASTSALAVGRVAKAAPVLPLRLWQSAIALVPDLVRPGVGVRRSLWRRRCRCFR